MSTGAGEGEGTGGSAGGSVASNDSDRKAAEATAIAASTTAPLFFNFGTSAVPSTAHTRAHGCAHRMRRFVMRAVWACAGRPASGAQRAQHQVCATPGMRNAAPVDNPLPRPPAVSAHGALPSHARPHMEHDTTASDVRNSIGRTCGSSRPPATRAVRMGAVYIIRRRRSGPAHMVGVDEWYSAICKLDQNLPLTPPLSNLGPTPAVAPATRPAPPAFAALAPVGNRVDEASRSARRRPCMRRLGWQVARPQALPRRECATASTAIPSPLPRCGGARRGTGSPMPAGTRLLAQCMREAAGGRPTCRRRQRGMPRILARRFSAQAARRGKGARRVREAVPRNAEISAA